MASSKVGNVVSHPSPFGSGWEEQSPGSAGAALRGNSSWEGKPGGFVHSITCAHHCAHHWNHGLILLLLNLQVYGIFDTELMGPEVKKRKR